MATVKDIDRSMRRESAAVEREQKILEHDLWADKEGAMPDTGTDEDDGRVEIMGANSPITINYGSPDDKPAPPAEPHRATGLPAWAKYLGTVLTAGAVGGGGVVGLNALTGDAPPPAVTADPVGDRWNEITVEKWAPDGSEKENP